MKKLFGISIVALLAILVFGFAGLALAQESTPAQPAPGQSQGTYAPGQMRGGRWAGLGGMQAGMGLSGEPGPWHQAVTASLAEAFGMAPDALQARLDGGETLWQVAELLGWTSEQLQSEMLAARSTALQQAVADSLLTQEQADIMAQRMNQGWPEGFGPGSANCDGSGQAHQGQGQGQGRQTGRGQGMRLNTLPTP